MEIKEISVSQMSVIIETGEPIGLFCHRECSDLFTGIDNSTGDVWMEQFRTLEKCLEWLNRIEEDLPMDIEEKQLIIFKHYGADHQLDRLIEECAELIQAITKLKRNRVCERSPDDFSDVYREIADVLNVAEQLIQAFGIKETVQDIQEMKLDRQLTRIKERENK